MSSPRVPDKFSKVRVEELTDREAIELLLRLCLLPRRKCRQLAEDSIKKFQNLRGFFSATAEELEQVGIPKECIPHIEFVRELPAKVLKEQIINAPAYQSSQDIADYLHYQMRDLKKEIFKVIYLNNRTQILETEDLFSGSLDSISIHPREIVESAIRHSATALIFAHNHPAGDPTPSRLDRQLTRDLVFIGMVLQIRVLDHVVIGANSSFSFAEAGLIQKYEDNFLNLKINGYLRLRLLPHIQTQPAR